MAASTSVPVVTREPASISRMMDTSPARDFGALSSPSLLPKPIEIVAPTPSPAAKAIEVMVRKATTPSAIVAVCASVTVSVAERPSISVPVMTAVAGACAGVAPAVVNVMLRGFAARAATPPARKEVTVRAVSCEGVAASSPAAAAATGLVHSCTTMLAIGAKASVTCLRRRPTSSGTPPPPSRTR